MAGWGWRRPGLNGRRRRHRSRSLVGTCGRAEIKVPRARLMAADGKTSGRAAPQARSGRADRRAYLSGAQHARGAPRARSAVWGRGGQGRGEPGTAEGAGRPGGLAVGSRRPQQARTARARMSGRRWWRRPGGRGRGPLGRRADAALYGPQASQPASQRPASKKPEIASSPSRHCWRRWGGAAATCVWNSLRRCDLVRQPLGASQCKSARTANAIERLLEEF
jgi:hypothetical protein